jgi:hypothetical protein
METRRFSSCARSSRLRSTTFFLDHPSTTTEKVAERSRSDLTPKNTHPQTRSKSRLKRGVSETPKMSPQYVFVDLMGICAPKKGIIKDTSRCVGGGGRQNVGQNVTAMRVANRRPLREQHRRYHFRQDKFCQYHNPVLVSILCYSGELYSPALTPTGGRPLSGSRRCGYLLYGNACPLTPSKPRQPTDRLLQ